MILTIGPELEAALKEHSSRRGIPVDRLATDALRDQFMPTPVTTANHDEWLAEMDAIAVDCGVSLTNEQLSRDHIYD